MSIIGAVQKSRLQYPGLTARPWHDPRDYPWTRRLERSATRIRRELERNLSLVAGAAHPYGDALADGVWDALFLFKVGNKRPACERFPVTTRIVESIPGATRAGLVYFSVLEPGAHVKPHAGPTNTRIRCHLGLITPKGAWLRVGRERRAWHAGKCLMFDDSFVHEAKNPSRLARVVLIVDVWHPEIPPAECERLYRVFREDIDRSEAGALARAGALRAFVNRGL